MSGAALVDALLAPVVIALGVFFFGRAILNLNHVKANRTPLIALLNYALMLGGVGLVVAPFEGTRATLLAAVVVLGVFAVCTLFGRRPTDRVLGP